MTKTDPKITQATKAQLDKLGIRVFEPAAVTYDRRWDQEPSSQKMRSSRARRKGAWA